MDVRRRTEEIEHLAFAPWATFSDASRGRAVPEPQDPLRPVFQRDRDRVLHCKAFRRLKQKTQVFLSPEGDLYRTRLTHTLEVSQIARTIARGLRLNEDLTEAMIWGIPPLATREKRHWMLFARTASATICKACVWWTGWKRTAKGST